MKTEVEIKTELARHEASAGQLAQDIAQLEAQINEAGDLLVQKRGQKHIHEIAIMAYRNVLSPSGVAPEPDTPTTQPPGSEDRYTQPALYRGEQVMIIPGSVLLSDPPQRNVKYADGTTGYALASDIEELLIEEETPDARPA